MKRLLGLLLITSIPGFASADIPPRFLDSIQYVKELQTPSGGYLSEKTDDAKPTLRATLAAIRAIHYFGGEISNKDKTQAFVASCYDAKKQGFADIPGGEVTVLSTSLGIMALVDLGMERKPYQTSVVNYLSQHVHTFEDIRIAAAAFESLQIPAPKAEEWVKEINKLKRTNATFGEGEGQARMTGSAVAAILRLGGKLQEKKAVLKAMRSGQQINGGFGEGKTPFDAELATSYRVMRSFHMLNANPVDVEGLRSFVEKCRNEDGGYSISPARPSSVGSTYYAGIILHWLSDEKK